MPIRTCSILVIEDRPRHAARVRAAFERTGNSARLEIVPDREKAVDLLKRQGAEVLFFRSESCGPDPSGLVETVNRNGERNIALIMVLPASDEKAALQAISAGVDDCVTGDPDSISTFPAVAARALARRLALASPVYLPDAVSRSRRRFMSVLDAITDYILVLDGEGRIVNVNKPFAAAFNMHPREAAGRKLAEFPGTPVLGDCGRTDRHLNDPPRTYEQTIGDRIYQISVYPLEDAGRSLWIHVMKDVTELRRLRDQLHHADKLASIGLLVSGVAHEINNPLTGTIAHTDLLMMTAGDELRQDLKKILESAMRCKKIIDNLLTFSRQNAPSKSLVSVNEIMDRTIDLRNYWLKRNNIAVTREYDPGATVYADAQQLQQVALNILLNAEQAISDSGQSTGHISFRTQLKRETGTILIRVSDNGPGIQEPFRSRVFDPFFSTKPVGVGTGLGLSVARGIVAEHGGTIHAEDNEGGGAVFCIDLPRGSASPGG